MKKIMLCAAALTLLGGAALSDDAGVKVGLITCEQTDRTNLVIWSEASFLCTYQPVKGNQEIYTGKIEKIGLDLTVNKIETLGWTVIAPSDDVADGALAGTYVGAGADVAVGAGAGVHGLIGGSKETINLQPVALSGETGFGLAAGIERFKLSRTGN